MDKKQELYKSGEKLFSSLGFKDTNIAKITVDAGLGVGTFYSYYPSKEDLFMDIYIDRNKALKKKMLKMVDYDDDPINVIGRLMEINIKEMTKDPILSTWYDKETYRKIEEKFKRKNGLDELEFMYDFFLDVIQRWQEQGRMRSDIDKEMIMAMFSAVITAEAHKSEIGEKYFPEVMNYLVAFLMDGLTNK